jgi:glycosyltransferase involved in cell wall biosynthesis
MLGVVMRTARMVAVHNGRVAADLRKEFPGTRIESIRLGTPAFQTDAAARGRVRASLGVSERSVLFVAFGTVTAEKRVGAVLRAVAALVREGADVHLLLAGHASECIGLDAAVAAADIAPRVHVSGYLPDEAIGDCLAAADACLCLRWPTALETSASWVQCLAAARPTLITDLAHLVDVPTIDPRGWRASPAGTEPIAIAIDLLDEEQALLLAMRRLAADHGMQERLARAGHAYWAEHHTLEAMAGDYRRLLPVAAEQPAPHVSDLPEHFLEDHSGTARRLAARFGIALEDVLGSGF